MPLMAPGGSTVKNVKRLKLYLCCKFKKKKTFLNTVSTSKHHSCITLCQCETVAAEVQTNLTKKTGSRLKDYTTQTRSKCKR